MLNVKSAIEALRKCKYECQVKDLMLFSFQKLFFVYLYCQSSTCQDFRKLSRFLHLVLFIPSNYFRLSLARLGVTCKNTKMLS